MTTFACAFRCCHSVSAKPHASKNSSFKSTGAYLLVIFLLRYTLRGSFSFFVGNRKSQPLLLPDLSSSVLLGKKKISRTLFTSLKSFTSQESFLFIGPRINQAASFQMKPYSVAHQVRALFKHRIALPSASFLPPAAAKKRRPV